MSRSQAAEYRDLGAIQIYFSMEYSACPSNRQVSIFGSLRKLVMHLPQMQTPLYRAALWSEAAKKKIVSKSLSLRLRGVLPSIIHEDQTCSVVGRSIADNVHLLRNVFDFVEQKNLKCAFMNLDQAKAFDRVSIQYLLEVLKAYGFGPSFIKWIKLLYTNISSAVIVNRHIRESFLVCRSVRQGCAISPLLYVLSMEPFANRVRKCVNFHGLKLPGHDGEVRITQYADDTTLVCTSIQSIPITLTLCKYFGKASGAKLNLEKTCGIWQGGWRDRQDKPFGISWVPYKKMLGVVFGHGRDDMGKYSDNWFPILEKLKKSLIIIPKEICRWQEKPQWPTLWLPASYGLWHLY